MRRQFGEKLVRALLVHSSLVPRILLGALVGCSVLAATMPALSSSSGPVPTVPADCTRSAVSKSTTCVISPIVTVPLVSVPSVTFHEGDLVTVHADGCVTTGGAGATRKSYVAPSGANSDRLNHGRIWIPGATDSLIRISAINDKTLVVSHVPQHLEATTPPLMLGYEDDNYDDNSLDAGCRRLLGICLGEDYGTGDQCKGVGPARIRLNVVRGPDPLANEWVSNGESITPALPPFDPVWAGIDDNWLPLNPEWAFHQHYRQSTGLADLFPNSGDPLGCKNFPDPHDSMPEGRSQECTDWDPDVDKAALLQAYCHALDPFGSMVHGHVNFGPVHLEGQIFFSDFQISPADYDFHLMLDTNGAMVTTGSEDILTERHQGVTLEFNRAETLDMATKGSWWQAFVEAVNDDARLGFFTTSILGKVDWPRSESRLNGRDAMAVGLLGIDNEHASSEFGGAPELHPIYALAVKTDGTAATDSWTFFARNWGTEGGCSHSSQFFNHQAGLLHGNIDYEHNLTLIDNTISLFFPVYGAAPKLITSAKLYGSYFHSTKILPIVRVDVLSDSSEPGNYRITPFADGVLLQLVLPNPGLFGFVYGDLEITRLGGPTRQAIDDQGKFRVVPTREPPTHLSLR